MNDAELSIVDHLNRLYVAKRNSNPALDPDLVYFLGDNPRTFAPTWSENTSAIPTFRLNNGFFYFPHARRWLTPVEKLACLAMPVCAELAEFAKLPALGVRDNHRAAIFTGNGMHLTNAALVQLVCLSCFRAKDAWQVVDRSAHD